MNQPATITADLDAPTAAIVHDIAAAWGMSEADLVREAVRRLAEQERDLASFLRVGADQIARGEFVEHEEFVENLRRWRKERVRPA